MGKHAVRYYYYIDFIDERGYAHYIDTFTSRQRKKAIKYLNILNSANQCLTNDTYFVLDKYACYDEDGYDTEIVEKNITDIKGDRCYD